MPYDSGSGNYIRRATTVLDETPDGDTVNSAVATKLDTSTDDAVTDLNHHNVNGGHYPATSVNTDSRYLKQSPAGMVSWASGVPIDQAALKDLSNVTAGVTANINISGNAATASSATSATSATTSASCSGNAATATDLAAGHVLAGSTDANALRGVINSLVSLEYSVPFDYNSATISGDYYVTNNAGNTNGPSTDAFHLVVTKRSSTNIMHVAWPSTGSGSPYWRAYNGVSWSTWTAITVSSSFTQSFVTSGWSKLPNGLILQWSVITTSTGGAFTWTYPIAFPNARLSEAVGLMSGNYVILASGGNNSSRSGTALTASTGVAATAGITFQMIAIGY